ncbi:MAG: HK97 gp10 family phage protein [Paracoccus sp. (in: a-proteobacteria)]|nr:HK97 gp10 family phage protein [Paracoccus sp. (in: a-proteobacteria)]
MIVFERKVFRMVDNSGLKRKLAQIQRKITAALTARMEKYAAELVAEMKALVPVESGALRDSIGWTWGDKPKGSMGIVTVKGRDTEGFFITIYAGTRDKSLGDRDAFYARMQEFGTKNHKANPFFYPVWRSNRRRIRSGLTREIKKAVKSI